MFTFGFITGNSWFKLTIDNRSLNEAFVFQLIEPFFQRVHFYSQKEGRWHKQVAGLNYYKKDHNPLHLTPIFNFTVEANTTRTVYIEFAPDAATAGSSFGWFTLASQNYFNHRSLLGHYTIYFFIFGSMFMIIIFNLFLSIKFGDRLYFYYAGYILFLGIYISIYTGLIHHFGLALWYRQMSLSMPLFVIFLILFTNHFLKLNDYLPLAYRTLQAIGWILFFSLPYMLYDYSNWMKIFGVSTVFIAPIAIFSAIYAVYKGHKEAKFYIYGMIFYVASLTVLPLMTKAVLPHTVLTHYAFSIFSYIEIMFFSFVLVNRFYATQNDKIKLQGELLEIKSNNEKILEKRVEKRTAKINKLLKEKEVLLREVYHRVKNNFHMVTSLLWIEHENQKSQHQKSSLLELINRIKSMALIHQYLLSADNYSQIQAHEYIERITEEIEKSYPKKLVTFHKSIDSFALSPDQSLYLGIIINELLTNSIKHYPHEDACIISINAKINNDHVTLEVCDNGDGFDYESAQYSSFGLQLIEEFGEKLKPTQSGFSFEEGTRYHLQFKTAY